MTFTLAMDAQDRRSVATKFGVDACPTNYLISPSGAILYRSVGFDEKGLREALMKAGIE